MTIQGFGGLVYVMPEGAAWLPAHALAGPFPDRFTAAGWIVEQMESKLTPAQVVLWADALERARALPLWFWGPQVQPEELVVGASVFHLIGLLTLIRRGVPSAHLNRYAGPAPVDRKRLAAGDT
jgi:hypothetical protein